jgi:hypothetical protein
MVMSSHRFRKTNHLAVAGFLLPFAAAGVSGALVLAGGSDFREFGYSLFYLILVPLILLMGLAASIRSIPRIALSGDRDYAYSGLTLNLLFLAVYAISLLYFFSTHS